MPPCVATALLLLLAGTVTSAPAPPLPLYGELLRHAIRERIEWPNGAGELRVAGELICPSKPLETFYRRRDHAPAWRDFASGELLVETEALLHAIGTAGDQGLDANDYHARVLLPPGQLGGRLVGIGTAADAELLLTDAFLQLASHLADGRVDPQSFDPDCLTAGAEVDAAALLEQALATSDVAGALRSVEPQHPAYRALAAALGPLRVAAAQGEIAAVPPGPTLEPGALDEAAIPALRARLAAGGYFLSQDPPADMASPVYDERLQAAVRLFQERHGLEPDARLGQRTRAALAIGAAARARQVELNLERWRWLPRDLGERFLLVNVADFSLHMEEGGREVLRMRAAVGRDYRRTPVFSSEVRQVVLAPWWVVPRRLAVEDVLPKIVADPGYLGAQGFVVGRENDSSRPVDPGEVDWTALGRNHFPYVLRQAPGPLNPLGRVKFLLPNPFDVYLHDTPSRGVFERFDRDVSSGCVRLERALELAAHLLADDPRWTAASLAAAAASGREQVVALRRPVPVHIQYWTAWVDGAGVLQFREDLYGRDARLDQALAQRASIRSGGAPEAERRP